MSNIVIAIDIGTSSAKGAAVLPDGSVLATFQKAYPLVTPQAHFVEQDPDVVAEAVIGLLKEVIDKTGSGSLLAISFSSAMHSVMLVDEAGRPLTNLLTWADTRSHEEAAALRKKSLGKKLHQITGTPIHPMSPLCKLMWMRRHMPDKLRHANKIVGIKEFVFYRLFNEWLVDHSIASATGLFDNQNLHWSPDALNVAGISAEQLSTPVPTTSFLTSILPDQAKRLGLDREIPFVMGASDGCLANLGSGVMKRGELAVTIGTSGAVRMTLKKYIPDEHGKIFNYILDQDHYVAGGATNNGAAVLAWFEKAFGRESEVSVPGDVRKIPAGCEGLVFLPYIFGERAPIYNPSARGVFFGIDIRHTRMHFRRAVMEGICFQIKSIIESMKSLGPFKKVMASGGFTNSKEWVQMLSHVLGREVLVVNEVDSSALGAARLAFQALGTSVTGDWTGEAISYTPTAGEHQVYLKQFQLFSSLYTRLEDLF
ncbi:MAG: gluconokinase [Cyclobacteriaceae bacterium]